MRIPGLAIACILAFGASAAAATYSFHPGHTEVRFYWHHAGVSEQSGEWGTVTGSVEFDPENIEATTVSVTILTDSINTGVSRLDDHLRSERFFDTAEYPEITFVSTGATQTGPKSVHVTGDLTIKGITHPLILARIQIL
jgi:polyisoprenoid-binding protein YceI